jgi:hypothetical protein
MGGYFYLTYPGGLGISQSNGFESHTEKKLIEFINLWGEIGSMQAQGVQSREVRNIGCIGASWCRLTRLKHIMVILIQAGWGLRGRTYVLSVLRYQAKRVSMNNARTVERSENKLEQRRLP